MNLNSRLSEKKYYTTLSHMENIEGEGRECIQIIKENFKNTDSYDVKSFCNGWDEMFFNVDKYKERLFEIKDYMDNAEMNLNHYEEYKENLENDIQNNEVFTKKDIEEVKSDMETMLKTTPHLLVDTENEREEIVRLLENKLKNTGQKNKAGRRFRM